MNKNGYPAGRCIHYRYDREASRIADASCNAGVRYGDIAGDADFGSFLRLPCFLDGKGKPKHAEARCCKKLQAPTNEEVMIHKIAVEERFSKIGVVLSGIKEWRAKHNGKSAQDTVECPACGGKLHLSISKINNHVRGTCETEGCVSWME